ncbi:MAG: S8 family serine peptidase [Bauldia sp.]
MTFNPTLAAQWRAAPEFQNVNADLTPVGPPQAHPYTLASVHTAFGAGIFGAGQLIALVDNGLRDDHQEFSGKSITFFGPHVFADHGTQVASIAAGGLGNGDGGMTGVAPDANLHFTAFNSGVANLAGGTLDAAGMGAVVQNNSWGYVVLATDFASFAGTNPGGLAADLAGRLGGSQSDWQNYLSALDTFQEGGVIVWAVSNDLASVDVTAALPSFQSTLGEAWIAVINGNFEVNSGGTITDAELLSAPCGMAASYCIAANGVVWTATAVGTNTYAANYGSSFAAPQVSGTVALVAQAFPTLTPEEITNRILVTANNFWFAAEGVSIDGVVDFGGITHGYSDVWGHGLLDVEAALSPIGITALVAGTSLATGQRTPIDSAGISVSSAFGDALVQGLSDRDVAVFDQFNGNFTVAADAFVTSRGAGGLYRTADLVRVSPGDFAPVGGAGALTTSDVVAAAYGADALASTTVLGLSRNASFVTGGSGGWSTFAYLGGQQATENAMAGFGASRSFDALGGRVTIGASQSLEQGAVLGLVGNEAFDFGRGTAITAGHLGYEGAIGDRFAVFANLEIGVASAFGEATDDLVEDIGPVAFNGFHVGANVRGVIADDDKVTVSVSRPLRVLAGDVDLAMPVGRTIDGAVTTEAVTVALAPEGRQLDFGFNYEIGLGALSTLRFAATYSLDAGNVADARGIAVAAGLGVGF